MEERERRAGVPPDDERPLQGAGAADRLAQASTADGTTIEEDTRHNRVMASAARVARKHRNVFAALAK